MLSMNEHLRPKNIYARLKQLFFYNERMICNCFRLVVLEFKIDKKIKRKYETFTLTQDITNERKQWSKQYKYSYNESCIGLDI